MTEPAAGARPAHAAPRPAGRQRMPKAAVRGWAWIAGVLAFLAPWAALKATPTPDATTAAAQGGQDRPLLVRTIVRRVVVVTPAPGRTGATFSSGTQRSGASTNTTGTEGVPPPQAPPVSTGGS